MASVLLTVGELSLVAGPALRPHIGDLLPLIIDAVQDPADSHKRNVAVVTLGNARKAVDAVPCGLPSLRLLVMLCSAKNLRPSLTAPNVTV